MQNSISTEFLNQITASDCQGTWGNLAEWVRAFAREIRKPYDAQLISTGGNCYSFVVLLDDQRVIAAHNTSHEITESFIGYESIQSWDADFSVDTALDEWAYLRSIFYRTGVNDYCGKMIARRLPVELMDDHTKYVLLREFVNGTWDFTEFGEDDKIKMYDNILDARLEVIDEYRTMLERFQSREIEYDDICFDLKVCKAVVVDDQDVIAFEDDGKVIAQSYIIHDSRV